MKLHRYLSRQRVFDHGGQQGERKKVNAGVIFTGFQNPCNPPADNMPTRLPCSGAKRAGCLREFADGCTEGLETSLLCMSEFESHCPCYTASRTSAAAGRRCAVRQTCDSTSGPPPYSLHMGKITHSLVLRVCICVRPSRENQKTSAGCLLGQLVSPRAARD